MLWPVAIALLGVFALVKLSTEFHRLTVDRGFSGAIDLRLRHREVQWWFEGTPIYTELRRLTYPPQAYALLWPFLGWLELSPARWLWALTTVLVLAGLAWIWVQGSGAQTQTTRAFVIVMVLSMNAVGVAVGNGQLVLHLLLSLVGGLLLLRRAHAGLPADAAAAVLLSVALVKPTLTAPFAGLAIIAARRWRPLLLTLCVSLVLALVAAAYQEAALSELIQQWWGQSRQPGIGRGYGDLAHAMFTLGIGHLAMPAGLILVCALWIWTYRRRQTDFWLLLGVTALVARFWTYHRVYDDTLILLPMLALFRLMQHKRGADTTDVTAGVLLALAVTSMLAPARMETVTPPLNGIFVVGHVFVWLAMLAFLVSKADATSLDPAGFDVAETRPDGAR